MHLRILLFYLELFSLTVAHLPLGEGFLLPRIEEAEAVCGPCKGLPCGAKGKVTSREIRKTRNVLRDAIWKRNVFQRALDSPKPGKLDEWFHQEFKKNAVHFVPAEQPTYEVDPETGEFDSGDDFGASFVPFKNKPLKLGLKEMCGCTSVIIASKRGAFMTHHWETTAMRVAEDKTPGGQEYFQLHVIEELRDKLDCLKEYFDRSKDPDVKVAIYTKSRTQKNADQSNLRYPSTVDEIKGVIEGKLGGVKKGDITIIPYYTYQQAAQDIETAEGKVILSYDPKAAEANKAGYELWAGSIFDANMKKIPHDKMNTPLMKATWSPTDEQKG